METFEELERKIESRKYEIVQRFQLPPEKLTFKGRAISVYDILNSPAVTEKISNGYSPLPLSPSNIDYEILKKRYTYASKIARDPILQNVDGATSNIIQEILRLGNEVLNDPQKERGYCYWLEAKQKKSNEEVERLEKSIDDLEHQLERAEQQRLNLERENRIIQHELENERKEKEELLEILEELEQQYSSLTLRMQKRLWRILQKCNNGQGVLLKILSCIAVLSFVAALYWFQSNLVDVKGEPTYKVISNDLPVYEYPFTRKLKFDPVQTLAKETPLILKRTFSGANVEWVEISLVGSPKIIGWIERKYTVRITPFPKITEPTELTLREDGRVRERPDTNSAIIVTLGRGDTIVALPVDSKLNDNSPEWQKIWFKDEDGITIEGWMHKRIIFE